jgi:hypothetical protein
MPTPRPFLRRLVTLTAFIAVLSGTLAGPASTASAQRGRGHGPRQVSRVVVVVPPRPTGFVAGEPVQAEWNGTWYDARVVAVEPNGTFRIHYEGWSEIWDEAVDHGRIRGRGNAAGAPPPPQVIIVPSTPGPVYIPPPPPPVYVPTQPPVRFPPQPPVYVPEPPPVYVPPVYVPTQPPVYAPNLLVNGGFESTPLEPGSYQLLAQIPGWFNTFGAGFEIQAGVAGTPFEGRHLLELDGDAPVGIAQDVNVQPAARYELRIAFSPRAGTSTEDNRIAVYFDGQLVGRIEANGATNGDTRWQVSTFFVSARTSRARLEIRDEGTPNSLGSYIDDVRLTAAR